MFKDAKQYDVDGRKIVKPHNLKTYKGKTYAEWALELNISTGLVSYHLTENGHLDNVGGKKYKGKTYNKWAEELGVSHNTIRIHLKKHEHLDNIGKWGSNEERNAALSYKGKTKAEWAEELGVAKGTIRDHIAKHGHLDYVNLSLKELNLVKKLKKDEENSQIFN